MDVLVMGTGKGGATMTNTYTDIFHKLSELAESILSEQMESRTASELAHDDRTADAIANMASALTELIEYGKEYDSAVADLEASGRHFDDGDIEQLLAERDIKFPLK